MTTTLINCRQLKLENQTWSKQSARELHCSSKWLKPAKNKFPYCHFTNLSKEISANTNNFPFPMIAFASYRKFVRVADISITRHFHEFFNFIFGGILLFGTTVRT